jgi:hypothetical protein
VGRSRKNVRRVTRAAAIAGAVKAGKAATTRQRRAEAAGMPMKKPSKPMRKARARAR